MAGPFLPKSFRPKIIRLVKQIDLETEPARKVKNFHTQVRSFRMGKFEANRGGDFGSELHQQCLVLQGFSDDFSHLGFGMGEKKDLPINTTTSSHKFHQLFLWGSPLLKIIVCLRNKRCRGGGCFGWGAGLNTEALKGRDWDGGLGVMRVWKHVRNDLWSLKIFSSSQRWIRIIES